jgi:hypothetical protein
MAWNVVFKEPAQKWYRQLGQRDRIEIDKTIRAIAQAGPGLRRPLVGTISRSRHHNMREARSVGGNQRILFAFDPNRHAVMLVGGDKTDRWQKWYRENIPKADRIYDQHLRGGGVWATSRGRNSGPRTR